MNKKYHLTPAQHKFIADNWQNMTHEQLAAKIKTSVSFMDNYCVTKGYLKQKKRKVIPVKKIINLGPTKKVIDRPKGEYSNVSREQHVSKWLNTQI